MPLNVPSKQAQLIDDIFGSEVLEVLGPQRPEDFPHQLSACEYEQQMEEGLSWAIVILDEGNENRPIGIDQARRWAACLIGIGFSQNRAFALIRTDQLTYHQASLVGSRIGFH